METPITYTFSNFQELVNVVPADRIQHCLAEVGAVLAATKMTCDLAILMAQEKAASSGQPPPEIPAQILEVPLPIEWIDDGKGKLGATIIDAAGNELDFNIAPEVSVTHRPAPTAS